MATSVADKGTAASEADKGTAASVTGRELRLGSTRYMNELGVDLAMLAVPAQQHEAQGRPCRGWQT